MKESQLKPKQQDVVKRETRYILQLKEQAELRKREEVRTCVRACACPTRAALWPFWPFGRARVRHGGGPGHAPLRMCVRAMCVCALPCATVRMCSAMRHRACTHAARTHICSGVYAPHSTHRVPTFTQCAHTLPQHTAPSCAHAASTHCPPPPNTHCPQHTVTLPQHCFPTHAHCAQEIRFERRQLKDRQQEDHLYEGKEKFVTAAYKKKLEEDRKWVEQEKLRCVGVHVLACGTRTVLCT